MAHIIYIENERGEQYKIELDNENPAILDELLDQLNSQPFKYITEAEFKLKKPFTMILMDKTMTTKLGLVVCENFNVCLTP